MALMIKVIQEGFKIDTLVLESCKIRSLLICKLVNWKNEEGVLASLLGISDKKVIGRITRSPVSQVSKQKHEGDQIMQ